MKILKPGKVEMRKFVCKKCGCVFTPDIVDFGWLTTTHMYCPQRGCDCTTTWDSGEPYEEPKHEARPKETDEERLSKLIMFVDEFYTSGDFVDYLIAHGVTFREDAP